MWRTFIVMYQKKEWAATPKLKVEKWIKEMMRNRI